MVYIIILFSNNIYNIINVFIKKTMIILLILKWGCCDDNYTPQIMGEL